MIAKVIDKGDGKLIVEYSATSPMETITMSMASMGEDKNVSIQTSSGSYDKGSVTIGGVRVPIIADLQAREESKNES